VAELDGTWDVKRTRGALPPLIGVTKRIAGDAGETRVGGLLRLPFDVEGLSLRYRWPLRGLVDLLEPEGAGFGGRAVFLGREIGRFELRPPSRG
jgi:hypothetical protein